MVYFHWNSDWGLDRTRFIYRNTAFQPNPVSIKVGDTVRWTNDDNMVHTVIEGNPATGDLPEDMLFLDY